MITEIILSLFFILLSIYLIYKIHIIESGVNMTYDNLINLIVLELSVLMKAYDELDKENREEIVKYIMNTIDKKMVKNKFGINEDGLKIIIISIMNNIENMKY